jgi:putative two-component system response regulator
MANTHNYDWAIDRDYCGQILRGRYSTKLKKRVASYISLFRNINSKVNPTIPYISAWRDSTDRSIWYEFVGTRLLMLLECQSCEAAELFRDSIHKRCSFEYSNVNGIIKEILDRDKLNGVRDQLRDQVKNTGNVEAVYKVVLRDGGSVWLKDQATLETFPDDGICLSIGALMDVTREMELEEQRQKEEDKLRLSHAELEKQLEKQNKKLWQTQLDIVYRLARAAELRDSNTGLHLTKMSYFCNILAKTAGLNQTKSTLIFHATPMHDVGKIGISETILQKPGKLSTNEFEIIKTHSFIGAKLLSGNDSPLLKLARTIALTHHERWDGTGYPNGLSQEQIPLSGRISAICDVFDALVSQRPYKKAWPLDNAFAEIQKGRGTHFDPHLVDLFLNNRTQFENIHSRFTM